MIEEVMRDLHVYTTKGGNIFAWTDDPELVEQAKVAVAWLSLPPSEEHPHGISYKIQEVPYTDAPGGKQKWELRGFPTFLLEIARQVASDQSVARGYAPIPGYEIEV